MILAKTVKGYGLGSTEARNASHQEKKLTDDGVTQFVKRFEIPLPDGAAKDGAFYRPGDDAPEIQYLKQRRAELGGFMPRREVPTLEAQNFKAPELSTMGEWTAGSKGRAVSTTMGFVSLLRGLLKDKAIGKLIVPIVPDEGRTFGLESAIKQVGIYAPEGQKYTPHDSDMLLSYREEKEGQILEEGITEAGSMASFTAAGHGVCELQGADGSLLHVLLDVWVSAHWGHGVGVCGLARQGLSDGRNCGPDDDAGRGFAASGWALDCAGEYCAYLCYL